MISVLIPSYNQQAYLPDAIESVLDQNVQGELIIVDDGSTDHSLEIARKYQSEHPEFIKVILQVNKGLASARNTGIMNAQYDWVYPLDADDMLADNALVKIIETMHTHPGADIIAPSMKTFGTSNEVIILMPNPTFEDFKTGNRIPYASAIRKSKLLEIGGYSPRMQEGYEDYHLWFNLLSRGAKIVTIPEPLFLYRTKKESMYTDALKYHEKLMNQIKKDFQW